MDGHFRNTNVRTDIVIIGAGPAGLSFALLFANTPINVVVIDKQTQEQLSNFEPDGRDIALTHFSKQLLDEMGVWNRIPNAFISPINEAKVLDGNSEYAMHFNQTKKLTVDALGYLVANHTLKEAIYKQSEITANITKIVNETVKFITSNDKSISVILSNNEKIEASLVVAADGRFSTARSYFGIAAQQYDFNQNAIVCKMQHEKSHNRIAYECFCYGGTLAVLPLVGKVSSIVITVPKNTSELITRFSEEEFNQYVEKRFKNKLGKMILIGKRHQYPLIAVYANHFVSHRFALLGDAAVGMHPVTAHGFNLGLIGQNTLSTLIKSAYMKKIDIGNSTLLEKYHTRHHRVCRPLYLGTNAIVRLFTNDAFVPKIVRKIALRAGNNFYPLKKIIIKNLTQIKSTDNQREFR